MCVSECVSVSVKKREREDNSLAITSMSIRYITPC